MYNLVEIKFGVFHYQLNAMLYIKLKKSIKIKGYLCNKNKY